MADDKTKRGSPDNKRLNKGEPYEVAYAKSKRAGAAKKVGAKRAPAGKTAPRSGGARAASGTTRARPTSASAPPAMKRDSAAPKRAPAPSTRPAPNPPKAEKTAENTAPKTLKEADAVDLLTDDHLAVGKLFKQYDKLAGKKAPAAERKTLAGTICALLTAHTTIEEEIFYPAARRAGIAAAMLDEADIEHASAKDLIAQIEAGSPADDHYDAKVKVLGEYITHHVVEEHTEMFPKCRRAGMDLATLRGEMAARKASILGEGAPPASDAKGGSPELLTKVGETLFSKA